RYVNGVIYLSARSLGVPGWEGLTLQEFSDAFFVGFNQSANTSINPTIGPNGEFDMDSLGIGEFTGLFTNVPLSDYISATRLQDETINGETFAHFVVDISLADLLSNAGILEFIMNTQLPGATTPLRPHELEAAEAVMREQL